MRVHTWYIAVDIVRGKSVDLSIVLCMRHQACAIDIIDFNHLKYTVCYMAIGQLITNSHFWITGNI